MQSTIRQIIHRWLGHKLSPEVSTNKLPLFVRSSFVFSVFEFEFELLHVSEQCSSKINLARVSNLQWQSQYVKFWWNCENAMKSIRPLPLNHTHRKLWVVNTYNCVYNVQLCSVNTTYNGVISSLVDTKYTRIRMALRLVLECLHTHCSTGAGTYMQKTD